MFKKYLERKTADTWNFYKHVAYRRNALPAIIADLLARPTWDTYIVYLVATIHWKRNFLRDQKKKGQQWTQALVQHKFKRNNCITVVDRRGCAWRKLYFQVRDPCLLWTPGQCCILLKKNPEILKCMINYFDKVEYTCPNMFSFKFK